MNSKTRAVLTSPLQSFWAGKPFWNSDELVRGSDAIRDIPVAKEFIQWGDGPLGLAKYCDHIKSSVVLHETGPIPYMSSHVNDWVPELSRKAEYGLVGRGWCGMTRSNPLAYKLALLLTQVNGITGGVPPPDLKAIINGHNVDEELRSAIRSIVKPKVDLPLFLLELSEVKHLATRLREFRIPEFTKQLRRVRQEWSVRRHKGKLITVKRAVRQMSDDYLAYEFGIKPLIRDLQSIVSTLRTLNKRAQRLAKGGTEIYSVHRMLNLNAGLPTRKVSAEEGDTGYSIEFQPILSKSVLTVRYRRRVPEMSALQAQIAQFGLDFGIRLNASTIWNHIPYSFVVDWSLGVGNFIADVEAKLRKDISYEIIDATVSFKLQYNRVIDTWPVGYDTSGHPWYNRRICSGPIPVATEMVSIYSRQVLDPGTMTRIIVDTEFQAKRITLGSALIIQRLTRGGSKTDGVLARAHRRLLKQARSLKDFSPFTKPRKQNRPIGH